MVKPRPADSAATAWTATDEKGGFHFSYLSILIQSYAKFALACIVLQAQMILKVERGNNAKDVSMYVYY